MIVSEIGSTTRGIAAREDDGNVVGMTLSSTPYFRQAVSDPVKRAALKGALTLKKDMYMTSGDKEMFDVSNALLAELSKYDMQVAQTEAATTGARFDTNNFFAV